MANTDAHGQLLAGLRYFLAHDPTISELVAANGIRTGFPNIELVQSLNDRPGGLLAAISIVLGKTTMHPQYPSGDSFRSSTVYSADGLTSQSMNETVRFLTSVSFIVTTIGLDGKTRRGKIVNAIRRALGPIASIPLPDSMDTADVVDPSLTTFGLKAQLIYVSEWADDKMDAQSFFRYDLNYNATHSDYTFVLEELIQGVQVTTITTF